ncbi:hypothetical protein RF11_09107 [Thelohanellus kitauei]|uniref:Uncharacterized protein n=1 Tax=Thelohanellus kitauei TaxID=669202 RepID=A0A0C2N187_THEKT|nr:hypothetical protein RF11_09107 [Thelohanellus kitauei]
MLIIDEHYQNNGVLYYSHSQAVSYSSETLRKINKFILEFPCSNFEEIGHEAATQYKQRQEFHFPENLNTYLDSLKWPHFNETSIERTKTVAESLDPFRIRRHVLKDFYGEFPSYAPPMPFREYNSPSKTQTPLNHRMESPISRFCQKELTMTCTDIQRRKCLCRFLIIATALRNTIHPETLVSR